MLLTSSGLREPPTEAAVVPILLPCVLLLLLLLPWLHLLLVRLLVLLLSLGATPHSRVVPDMSAVCSCISCRRCHQHRG
jgi:hypothetical protein